MSTNEDKIRRAVASADETMLEALANRGLIRRARKDIERGLEIRVVNVTDAALRVQVGHYVVAFTEAGVAAAICSCPASGVCQHVLVAVFHLRENQPHHPEPSATDSVLTELMAFTTDALQRWAGTATFAAAERQVSESAVEIIREPSTRIRFLARNVEVHVVPGAGLDGMIVAGGGRNDERQTIVAAVLAFQRAGGAPGSTPAAMSALNAADGAPRTRREVLQSCDALLAETLSNGLARLAQANQQRWATLAISALGVNLPRLALLLRAIGDDVALAVARDARSDLSRLLMRMGHAHGISAALKAGGDSPRSEHVGLHRTQYDDVGHLDLVGAAAWPWRTASGHRGLTVLFWEPATGRWSSWSDSRSGERADFNPRVRFGQSSPWDGADSPEVLARSVVRLMNARRNPHHRLSGSSKSRVLVTGPARLMEHGPPPVRDWTELATRVRDAVPLGLTDGNPLDAVVAVAPAMWGERVFDTVRQVFSWTLTDAAQRALRLEIPFDADARRAIERLETLSADVLPGAVVIGRVQHSANGLTLYPYSIHLPSHIVHHIFLDGASVSPTGGDESESTPDEGLDDDEEIQLGEHVPSSIDRLIGEVDDTLLSLAEAGLATPSPLRLDRLRENAIRVERLGLEVLGHSLYNAAANPTMHSVLRCCFLTQMHRRARS